MRVRINIPAWGAREVASGAAALASGARGRACARELGEALGREVPGWSVALLASARYGVALAARRLGLEGRRVAVPGYVCPAVLTGLRAAGAEPVPVDCLPSSTRFDPEALSRAAARGEVEGVLAPNTYGIDQDYDLLAGLGLPVVEDAAYQAGRRDDEGRACGTRGDAGVWSFNFKALAGVGGGALLVRGGPAVEVDGPGGGAGEALRFANYAARALARHRIPGFLPGAGPPPPEPPAEAREGLAALREAGMSGLQAAVALSQWEARERLAARQRVNTAALDEAAERCAGLTPLAPRAGAALPHLYPLAVAESPDARARVYRLRAAMHARGVQTEDPYPVLLGGADRLPNSHALAARLLLVPCNASVGPRQIEAVAAALAQATSAWD